MFHKANNNISTEKNILTVKSYAKTAGYMDYVTRIFYVEGRIYLPRQQAIEIKTRLLGLEPHSLALVENS